MTAGDDDDEIRIGGGGDDDDESDKTHEKGAPGDVEITGGQYLFDTICEVLGPLGLDMRLKIVGALDEGDWAKVPPEVRKVFEDIDELYFDDED